GSRHHAHLDLAGALLHSSWTEERVMQFVAAVAVATEDEEQRGRLRNVQSTVGKAERGEKTTGWPSLAKYVGDAGVARCRHWLGIVGPTIKTGEQKKSYRPLVPYRPFPVDSLPEPMREYVTEGIKVLRCDPSFIALPAIAAAGAVIGTTRMVRLRGGAFPWTEFPIFWTGVVADSGTIKSPAFDAATRPVFAMQREFLEEFRTAMLTYQEEVEAYKEASKRKNRRNREDEPDEEAIEAPVKPVLRRVVTADVTIE